MKDLDQIYMRPDLYDQAFGLDGDDVAFFSQEAVRSNGPVLELGCGTGRVLNSIAKLGLACTGIDLAPAMIERAQSKAHANQLKVNYQVGDMRTFQLQEKFKFVFIAMNSLLHLHDRISFEQLFSSVRRHLADGGTFCFSIFNPSLQILSRNPSERFFVNTLVDSESNETITIEETTDYDLSTQVSTTRWFYSKPGQPDYYDHSFKLRVLFPQEIQSLCFYNGFKVQNVYGNYQMKKFEGQDRLQILSLISRP